jgi:dTDP-4-dehydrorhamnose reductase
MSGARPSDDLIGEVGGWSVSPVPPIYSRQHNFFILMPKNICILGASGMLGSAVLDVFAKDEAVTVTATVRDAELGARLTSRYPSVKVVVMDAEAATYEELDALLKGFDYVVNAIGIIKPYIHDTVPAETERAVRVNALFPHLLARAAYANQVVVLQIATDCVFSGAKGDYVETDTHDALDVYGKSKSLGEVAAPGMCHLRCSIIGPEPKAHVSLLDWFLGQEKGASVNGFTNHYWNGVTTVHFGRICLGIVKGGVSLPQLQHMVPSGKITKADLLKSFAAAYGRQDIIVNPMAAEKVIDRTVATAQPDSNAAIWAAAGYATPPTVEQMVEEMAAYHFAE